MFLRLGLPVLALWIVGGSIAGIATTRWIQSVAIGLPVAVTALAVGVVLWSLRQAKKAKAVAGLIGQVNTADDRKAAIAKLEQDYKKNDPAAVFAKAQLLLQENPEQALKTLEQIDLSKVQPNVADEARAQRAMIHLLLGQVQQARPLADGIELKRHEDPRSRAMMVSVMAEAWARSGQAKRATETLSVLDPEDPAYEQVRPQLWRALAFSSVYSNDSRNMKRALRKLVEIDPRMLAGFLGKKTHPMLQKEAKRMLEQSGAIPRKIVYQRS
jgi:tetratricopeptide (TPR) repeat protein